MLNVQLLGAAAVSLLGLGPVNAVTRAAPVPPDSLRLGSDRLIGYTFANDAYFRTDYYFTQGMTGTSIHPALARLPTHHLLRLGRAKGTEYFGVRVHYDGFTPLRIQDAFIRVGDRPYASYLYADFFRTLNRPTRHLRLTTGLQLGVIGPAAGAKGFQTKLHKWLGAPTPRGWDYQIQNDLVLGYMGRLEGRLAHVGRAVELIGGATASLGTLRTYAGADARLRVGLLNPYFANLGVSSRANRQQLRRVQLYTEARLEGRVVGYDATLQGGLLRRDNPYELPAQAISRTVAIGTGTLGLGYAGVRLETSAFWISPEFAGARSHKWTQFSLLVGF
ncbi:lipid A deacylase LpxR family protein [Hymenobacter lutimineralis]|uniref:Lipid A deacylase LpxR family protein n=1 Tax=Hymenobacter lutimineralis TaxID=2606448 RepID=A0A5D6V1E6_9BACT|nr:lipid A deacylase LpxR family protein [Hymenobacter lutimineralis]TYZ08848.1 lipid A deacylase LpxR family protein [Hymenobacter lutimineralis]